MRLSVEAGREIGKSDEGWEGWFRRITRSWD